LAPPPIKRKYLNGLAQDGLAKFKRLDDHGPLRLASTRS